MSLHVSSTYNIMLSLIHEDQNETCMLLLCSCHTVTRVLGINTSASKLLINMHSSLYIRSSYIIVLCLMTAFDCVIYYRSAYFHILCAIQC